MSWICTWRAAGKSPNWPWRSMEIHEKMYSLYSWEHQRTTWWVHWIGSREHLQDTTIVDGENQCIFHDFPANQPIDYYYTVYTKDWPCYASCPLCDCSAECIFWDLFQLAIPKGWYFIPLAETFHQDFHWGGIYKSLTGASYAGNLREWSIITNTLWWTNIAMENGHL